VRRRYNDVNILIFIKEDFAFLDCEVWLAFDFGFYSHGLGSLVSPIRGRVEIVLEVCVGPGGGSIGTFSAVFGPDRNEFLFALLKLNSDFKKFLIGLHPKGSLHQWHANEVDHTKGFLCLFFVACIT
jgi:hypothetical protein